MGIILANTSNVYEVRLLPKETGSPLDITAWVIDLEQKRYVRCGDARNNQPMDADGWVVIKCSRPIKANLVTIKNSYKRAASAPLDVCGVEVLGKK